jgi:hypothetical protein
MGVIRGASDMITVVITVEQRIRHLSIINIVIGIQVPPVVIIIVDGSRIATYLKSLVDGIRNIICVFFRHCAIFPTAHPMEMVFITLKI